MTWPELPSAHGGLRRKAEGEGLCPSGGSASCTVTVYAGVLRTQTGAATHRIWVLHLGLHYSYNTQRPNWHELMQLQPNQPKFKLKGKTKFKKVRWQLFNDDPRPTSQDRNPSVASPGSDVARLPRQTPVKEPAKRWPDTRGCASCRSRSSFSSSFLGQEGFSRWCCQKNGNDCSQQSAKSRFTLRSIAPDYTAAC